MTTRLRGVASTTSEAGIPLIVLAGKEYGSGSSRDWAAKGTALLGVKAVIAESYERIHRSNLIGMGVLPLQFPGGKTADDMGLTGEETISISGITELNDGATPRTVTVQIESADGRALRRVRGDGPDRHPRRGELLPQRRDHAVRPAQPAQGLSAARRRTAVTRALSVRRRRRSRVSRCATPRPA